MNVQAGITDHLILEDQGILEHQTNLTNLNISCEGKKRNIPYRYLVIIMSKPVYFSCWPLTKRRVIKLSREKYMPFDLLGDIPHIFESIPTKEQEINCSF